MWHYQFKFVANALGLKGLRYQAMVATGRGASAGIGPQPANLTENFKNFLSNRFYFYSLQDPLSRQVHYRRL
jgi:hypothetical protein